MNYSKNGYGIKISKLWDKYEGEFKLNKKEEIGTYCWSNYSIYEGEVKNNFRDGFGIIYKFDGSIFQGEWKQSKHEDIWFSSISK